MQSVEETTARNLCVVQRQFDPYLDDEMWYLFDDFVRQRSEEEPRVPVCFVGTAFEPWDYDESRRDMAVESAVAVTLSLRPNEIVLLVLERLRRDDSRAAIIGCIEFLTVPR